jgi:type IV pilus assembly protein PilX
MNGLSQRGVAVFVVMVMALLGSLLVLWSARSALLGEMLTGNDSDHQRALEAAHAMIRDAELDIRGENADGSPCAAPLPCRPFPADANAYHDLRTALAAGSPSCDAGMCVSDGLTAQFWTSKTALEAMKAVAATYGAHTGAKAQGHPLLADKAWYWVEVLPYRMGAAIDGGAARDLAPDRERPYIYRITAVAEGHKPATRVVVQAAVIWKKAGA